MDASTACNKIKEKFGDQVLSQKEFRKEFTLLVEADAIVAICRFAKESLGFNFLADLSSVDHMGTDPRFEVVYELYSIEDCISLRLKVQVGEDQPAVASVSGVWATADWHEREVWDLMGIRFVGHPDLRRILMWEGYPHHPLRKDFPLAGLPTEVPEVGFTNTAPLAGGPFVTAPTSGNTQVREPRARDVENLPPKTLFLAEP